MAVVAKASKKFIFVPMTDDDFITLSTIEHLFIKAVIGIMQWLHLKKKEPWILFRKNVCNDNTELSKYNMKPKSEERHYPQTFSNYNKNFKAKDKIRNKIYSLISFPP